MKRLSLTIAVLASLALPAFAHGADVQVGRFAGGPPTEVRPGTLGIGAKSAITGISWESWNATTAKGNGVYDIAGFADEPGTGYSAPTGLTFSDLRSCGSTRVYTTLTLQLTQPIDGQSTQTFTDFTKCPTASKAVTRTCGRLGVASGALVVTNIRATRASCSIARRVAGSWRRKAGCGQLPPDGPTTCSKILGYDCTRISGSGESLVYRCRNGAKSVRFNAGS